MFNIKVINLTRHLKVEALFKSTTISSLHSYSDYSDSRCVGFYTPSNSLVLSGHQPVSYIQFSSDTASPESTSPTGGGLSLTKLPMPASDANCKSSYQLCF